MTDLPTTSDPLFLSFQLAVAGRYSIDRELGRGGMGIVYLAREVHLDRLVAIKLLPPELSVRPALRERFIREAQLAAKLSHPNIIPIHTVAESGEFVYYVMAFVDGLTLAQRVQSRGPLSARDGTRLLREVAWALSHAHGQGLVHRDVKPDNILIENGTERALVADFGIAAATGEALGDGVVGTPEFMSPEQALGHEVDARSDLYSLGATAYYALSGRLPFDGKNATEVLARQVTEIAPPLSTVGVSVPRKLAQVIDRCLSKNPADRPANAHALAEQLSVAVEQRRELPVALRAFVKRNGRMNGMGTIAGLLGALAFSVGTSAVLGPAAGVATLLGSIALAPLVFGVLAARRLLSEGFTHQDLAPAFQSERELSREERGLQGSKARSAVEWFLSGTARVAGSTSVTLLGLALIGSGSGIFKYASALAYLGLGVATFATIGHIALLQARRDVDVEFWGAAWSGRYGALAFAMAKRWRGKKAIAPTMTHRATELSLGIAAEQLFESLPKATRSSLGDLPGLLERLQRDARVLRTRHDGLQDALQGAGGAVMGDDYNDVRAERDLIHERLRVAVGALETIRLSLLRLHAGSLSLEGMTTNIEMAVEVSEDVERLIAARQEVEDVLSFPRDVELTPV